MAQLHGAQSRDFLQRLIAGKSLRLMPVGKESTGGMPIDPYRRMLCMAYLTAQMEVGRIAYFHDGVFESGLVRRARTVCRNIELEMIVNGWAWVVERYAFDREAEYLAAQDDARRARRGLWVVRDPEPPWSFKRRHKRSAVDRQYGLL
ncbi:thermonuclease family protein [Sphingobium sp. BYY-5]|uniref:thermonuclease family protein n=1 Tax=Sphingobium sp. BYY-5 TaxID=2926400 RepID=UPI001FA79421|nr:thermonuclease family protein [Sphingobium sp. BYY-5]MCI4590842.1 thermonuclease family protein [Sphingobium sp. BYY-5]